MTSIGLLGKVVTGRTPSTTQLEFYGGPFKLISPANLNDSKYVTTAHNWLTEAGLSQARELPKNTVLVSCIGNIGKVGLTSDERSATNQQINAIICRSHSDPHFVYYLLAYYQRRLETFARRTVVPILSKSNFEQIVVPLPPLPEQRRIAHVLSTIQRAIQAQDAVIAAARELKRSLMQRLFTYGPYAEPLLTKETEIGEVPEGWEVLNLGSLSKMVRYGTSMRCSDEVHGLPVLRIPNVIDGVINLGDLKYAALPSAEVQRLSLQDGDLLFVRTNGQKNNIGRSAVFHQDLQEALFASYLICVRLDRDMASPDFVNGYLGTDLGRAQVIGMASGAADGKFNINSQTIRSLVVPVPPAMSEQQEIAGLFDRATTKVRVEEQRKIALQALFKSMLHQLMTGQVRVPAADFGSRRV